jgi:hypothetical protein
MEPRITPHLAARRPWWALVVAVVALTAAVALLTVDRTPVADPSAAPSETSMLAVSPGGRIALADLPADQQPIYQAAAADPDAFSQVACYCGCESFLDHRNLSDCFVRPDGGWERHATGCAVCLAEARDVIAGRETGDDIADISERIDQRFGAITAPTA